MCLGTMMSALALLEARLVESIGQRGARGLAVRVITGNREAVSWLSRSRAVGPEADKGTVRPIEG